MTAYRLVDITCDHCNTQLDCTASTVAEARQQAREEGWVRRGKSDICADCLEAEN